MGCATDLAEADDDRLVCLDYRTHRALEDVQIFCLCFLVIVPRFLPIYVDKDHDTVVTRSVRHESLRQPFRDFLSTLCSNASWVCMGSWATSSSGLSHHKMNIDVTLVGNRSAYWGLIPTYPELVYTRSSAAGLCSHASGLLVGGIRGKWGRSGAQNIS